MKMSIRHNYSHLAETVAGILAKPFDASSESHRAAYLLLLSLQVPHTLANLVAMSGFREDDIARIRARFVAAEIWADDLYCVVLDAEWAWDADGDSGISFVLDSEVGAGNMRRVREDGEWKYQITAVGQERVEELLRR